MDETRSVKIAFSKHQTMGPPPAKEKIRQEKLILGCTGSVLGRAPEFSVNKGQEITAPITNNCQEKEWIRLGKYRAHKSSR